MTHDAATPDGYTILRCAFPDGIPPADYEIVIRIMEQNLSRRATAQLLAALTGNPFDQTLHDIQTTLATIVHDSSCETIGTPHSQAVLDRLIPCGYEIWSSRLHDIAFPGTLLAHDNPIKTAFLQRYRSHDVAYSSRARTWTLFDPDLPGIGLYERADVLDGLANPVFARYPVVYAYSEQGPTYATTMADIWIYMEDKNPWQEHDFYIVPPDLSWCVAITHDDYLIAVGAIVPILKDEEAPLDDLHSICLL